MGPIKFLLASLLLFLGPWMDDPADESVDRLSGTCKAAAADDGVMLLLLLSRFGSR